jgi:hypothetical protein
MAAPATMRAARMRWGDAVDDEDSGVVALPMPQVSQSGNVKTVIEYLRNEKGDAVKRTTRYKVVTVEKKVYEVLGGLSFAGLRLPDLGSSSQANGSGHCAMPTASLLFCWVVLQVALERRNWRRYGGAKGETAGDSITVQVWAMAAMAHG